MGPELWDYIKAMMNWIVVPVLGLVSWSYKKQLDKTEKLEEELQIMKIENAMIKQQLINITERLNELKALVNVLIEREK